MRLYLLHLGTMQPGGVPVLGYLVQTDDGTNVRESNRVMVAAVATACGDDEHRAAVAACARSVWKAWGPHHDTVRGWAGMLRIS